MISVFVSAYNESALMSGMVGHYRDRFPACAIYVSDNCSTDGTADMARSLGCDVNVVDTGGVFDEHKFKAWKNNVWRAAKSRWVLVADVDEWLEIDERQLHEEQRAGRTIVRGEGYHMVTDYDGQDASRATRGVRDKQYDKSLLFDRTMIRDINYGWGCHTCAPRGKVVYTAKAYKLWHMRWIGANLLVAKKNWTLARRSERSTKAGFGHQYNKTDQQVLDELDSARKSAVTVRT